MPSPAGIQPFEWAIICGLAGVVLSEGTDVGFTWIPEV